MRLLQGCAPAPGQVKAARVPGRGVRRARQTGVSVLAAVPSWSGNGYVGLLWTQPSSDEGRGRLTKSSRMETCPRQSERPGPCCCSSHTWGRWRERDGVFSVPAPLSLAASPEQEQGPVNHPACPHPGFSLLQLVLDSQKRVFSWGFGGYGRLGHAEQKDEMVPRLVKLFDFPGRGASQIYAGYTCSFAVSEVGESLPWQPQEEGARRCSLPAVGAEAIALSRTGSPGAIGFLPVSFQRSTPWSQVPRALHAVLMLLKVRIQLLRCLLTAGLCLSSPGGLFFWGATNTSRESTMYPKAVQDLCGWRIRSLACGYVAVSPGEQDWPRACRTHRRRLVPGAFCCPDSRAPVSDPEARRPGTACPGVAGPAVGGSLHCPRGSHCEGFVLRRFGALCSITGSKVYCFGDTVGFSCPNALVRKN